MGRRIDRLTGCVIDHCGLPHEYVSCPGCGFKYGYRGRKVCTGCDECSECCHCPEPKPPRITGPEKVAKIVAEGVY